MDKKVKEILDQMTLEEKASLCSGLNFWYMKGVERLGVSPVMVTDGPHGLRKQAGDADHLGINVSVPSTCFPPAVTTASGFSCDNAFAMGQAIGEECLQEEVAVVLGPGTNIKRSPLCGRNFEYFSEDPYLAGEMAAAWIKGVQSKGVGTSLKHYAGNSQEKARLTGNSVMDARALREIYLPAFEAAVKKAQPWTLMCSYNKINDVYSCENPWLLDQVLRGEWGFEGLVMTDWGAMNDRVEALKAGLELEMPGPAAHNDKKIVKAVEEGTLDIGVLDQAVERLLTLLLKADRAEKKTYDVKAHHALARKAAAESMVLLKNEDMLPLCQEKSYAVVGAFAKTPRYQGAGSSKINPHFIDSPYEELEKLGINCSYAAGYTESDEPDEALLAQATELAKEKDGVIVFAGLPDAYESEGFDRSHIRMPASHNALIEAVAGVNPNVTVVLMCGSVVEMPWRDRVQGILLAYLGGQAAGGACADVLTGRVNPSGRLAETFPLSLEDVACREHFAHDRLDVEYRESILVGYRYYDWAGKEVAYPFGHGLSYTSFAYDSMEVSWSDADKEGSVKVRVTNTGDCDGAEVVQLYIGKEDTEILRAPRELKGFAKVFLKAGESKTVEMPLEERSFAYFNTAENIWAVEDGSYQLSCAASSRDLRLTKEIRVSGTTASEKQKKAEASYFTREVMKEGSFAATREQFETLFGSVLPFIPQTGKRTVNTRVCEVLADPKGREIFADILTDFGQQTGEEDDVSRMMAAMMMDMPIRSLGLFAQAELSDLEERIKKWNA